MSGLCPLHTLYIHTYQVSCKSVIQITFVLYVYNDVYTISTPYNTHFEAACKYRFSESDNVNDVHVGGFRSEILSLRSTHLNVNFF